MLIVIEGLDGSGKSTQVRKVKEYIQSSGKELKYLHFPRFEAPVVGEVIARFLRGDFGTLDRIDPMLVAYLFAEDRRDASRLVRKWLSRGNIVLFDRYVYSNIAFQCAKIEDPEKAAALRDWIWKAEYETFGIPYPDLNLFLDVPIDFVQKRLKENRSGKDRAYLDGKEDIHETDIDFQKKVREVYLRESARDDRFIRLDCADDHGRMLPPDRIFSKIKEQLTQIITL